MKKRNAARYQSTMDHGKNYDAKNMMHVFRLLKMAKEIVSENRINVRRTDRLLLLQIKKGEREYDELVQEADKMMQGLKELYLNSSLSDTPDLNAVNQILVRMRTAYYQQQ
ncbi:MAG TPA: hypothetical protein VF421_03160 [Niabella sp.]